MTSHVQPMPKIIQESIVTQIKCLVQHSIIATQAVQAFMICKTGCCIVLVCCQDATVHSIYATNTQKLISLPPQWPPCSNRSQVSAWLLKSLLYLCRYRRSLAIYLATELYLLPCGRKRTALVPRSIAIIVDLHKIIFSSERWVGPKVTSRHRYVREAPQQSQTGSQAYGFSFFGMQAVPQR